MKLNKTKTKHMNKKKRIPIYKYSNRYFKQWEISETFCKLILSVRRGIEEILSSKWGSYLNKCINFRGTIISRGFEFAVFNFAVLPGFSYFQPTFQHFLPNFVVFSPYFDIFLLFSRRSQPRKLVHREN